MNQVFLCPLLIKYGCESYRVFFAGRVCSPDYNSKGAAAAYLEHLENGRKPKYFACLTINTAPSPAPSSPQAFPLACHGRSRTKMQTPAAPRSMKRSRTTSISFAL